MTLQPTLASLLDAYMRRASVGDARLANQVNSIAGNACSIHRSTLRNWRTGVARKVNSWQQLATVAIALRLDESEANALLESGGCPSIQALAATSREADQALLAYWSVGSGRTDRATPDELMPESTPGTGELASRARQLPSSNKEEEGADIARDSTIPEMWKLVGAGVLVLALSAATAQILSPGSVRERLSIAQAMPKNLLVNSRFEQGSMSWIAYVNDAASARFKVVDESMHLQIDEVAEHGWHVALSQKGLEIGAGKTYTVRFRVRGVDSSSMRVDITRVLDPKTSLSFLSWGEKSIDITSRWADKVIEYEAIETTTLEDGGARLLFMFGKSSPGEIMLDDIELFEGRIVRDDPESDAVGG